MPFAQFPMHQKSGYLSKHHRLDPDTKGYQPNFQVVGVSSFEGLSVCRSLQYLGRSKTLLAHYAKRNWTCYSEPNIKGNTGTIPYINTLEGAGAFETDIQGQVRATGTTNTAYCYLNLNASAYNSIYSDSVTTVRPEAFRAYCLIRYS